MSRIARKRPRWRRAVLIGGEDCGSLSDGGAPLLRARRSVSFTNSTTAAGVQTLENVCCRDDAGVARGAPRQGGRNADRVGLAAARPASPGAAVGRRTAARRDRRALANGSPHPVADETRPATRPRERRQNIDDVARTRPSHRPRRADPPTNPNLGTRSPPRPTSSRSKTGGLKPTVEGIEKAAPRGRSDPRRAAGFGSMGSETKP